MKLQNIKFNRIDNNAQQDKIKTSDSNVVSNDYLNGNLRSYPSSYYLNFGTRSIKEVYDNHAEVEMPSTVKCFIDDLALTLPKAKFEMLIAQPRLYQIQKEAFRQLDNCCSVEDIKKEFVSEKCLRDIKSSKDVSQTGNGIFNIISAKQNQGKKVFDIEEDLSVYLAKQLFYECVSMTDIQKNLAALALDEEVKEKIQNSSTWSARTFLPLGIIVPDGKKYGKAVLYSEDRKYSTALSEALRDNWNTLSPEEVTKRIDKLLQGSKKERLTMIDAWNKCIPIRNELSDFLFENLDSYDYAIEQDDVSVSFYEGNFPIKMRKLMIAFWDSHPQEKEDLSLQIKKSRKIYEEKLAQGPEVFEAYEKEVLSKANLIKLNLLEERQKARSFGAAKQLIKAIAQRSNQMYIKNDETVEDLYAILLQHITNKQLRIYEQRLLIGDNSEEFNQVYPPYEQINEAKNSFEYFNIMTAQVYAILLPDLKRGKISEKELLDAIQNPSKFKELIANAKASRTSVELSEYSRMKKLLSQSEKDAIKETLVQYINQDEKAMGALDAFLDAQGKYLLQVNSENKLIQNMTILLTLQKLDDICEENFAQNYIKQIEDEKLQQKKIDILKTIDWSKFNISSWDI